MYTKVETIMNEILLRVRESFLKKYGEIEGSLRYEAFLRKIDNMNEEPRRSSTAKSDPTLHRLSDIAAVFAEERAKALPQKKGLLARASKSWTKLKSK